MDLKRKLLSCVTVKFENGELSTNIELDKAVDVLFTDLIEPAADAYVVKTANTMDDLLDATAMPLIKKEAIAYAQKLEDKLKAKIDEKIS